MGALTSRQNAGVEEVDIASTHAYKYPPRSGNYFGSHFIMGGERFDTPQPEAYLFGENSDLNFLGSKPTPFPYPPPQPNEPTKTLKSLINIRKESLRFVRAPLDKHKLGAAGDGDAADAELGKHVGYNIEFIFDADVKCSITIYYFCTEEVTPRGVTYVSRNPMLTSETFHYKRGASQHFCQSAHVFIPSKYSEDELLYDVDREVIPIVVHCATEEGIDDARQSHTTVAVVEKSSEGVYLLKALKQKLFVDGLCYLLQEIYGIENKNNEKIPGDEDTEDSGSECVICMSDIRDTLILPCRHLCLCNSCADSLRYQANNCPICRAPFRALLQIKALQKSSNAPPPPSSPPDQSNTDNIPPGYETVSLIEALNGPAQQRQPPSAVPDLIETPESEQADESLQIIAREAEPSPPKTTGSDSSSSERNALLGRDGDTKETLKKCPLLSEKGNIANSRNKNNRSARDTVKVVNEKCDKAYQLDEDSEAEKLSPLLQKNDSCKQSNTLGSNMNDVEPIDDADFDQDDVVHPLPPEKAKTYVRSLEERADESDYYTPDELAPSIVALYENDTGSNSMNSTPQKLPGTPLSHVSGRSSGESYSSGSSTRHLLAVNSKSNTGSDDKVLSV